MSPGRRVEMWLWLRGPEGQRWGGGRWPLSAGTGCCRRTTGCVYMVLCLVCTGRKISRRDASFTTPQPVSSLSVALTTESRRCCTQRCPFMFCILSLYGKKNHKKTTNLTARNTKKPSLHFSWQQENWKTCFRGGRGQRKLLDDKQAASKKRVWFAED